MEFWLEAAALFIVPSFLTALVGQWWSGLLFILAWIFVCGRRLHDVGRSAWWSVGALGLAMAPLAIFTLVPGSGIGANLVHFEPKITLQSRYMLWGLFAEFLIQAAFIIWLGVQRGQPVANSYGPARGKAEPAPSLAPSISET